MNSNALVKFLKRVTCISDNESRKKNKIEREILQRIEIDI